VTQILYETQKTESTAVFAQYTYDVTDKLQLEAGGRWTEEKKHFIAGQAYLSNEARSRERNFAGYADLNNTWDEVSLHFGASYQIDDNKMLYASFSEGFHSGGFFGVNQNIRDYERDQYDPEFATSIEVGFKSMLLDDRLRLNLTAFHNEFEDKQESYSKIDPDTKTVASVFDNAAEVLYEGWEAEILFAVTPDLKVFLNAGFLDAAYEEFETDLNPGDNVTIVEDATFLKPRNAPDSTIGVGFNFTTRIGNGELDIFAKYTKIDDFETDVLNLNAGRVTGGNADDLSATIAYYFDNYSVSLFGKNLTDERVEFATLLGGSNVSASLFNVGTITRPRSLGLEFTAEF
jgi:iron complex outermembrane receptor protein